MGFNGEMFIFRAEANEAYGILLKLQVSGPLMVGVPLMVDFFKMDCYEAVLSSHESLFV